MPSLLFKDSGRVNRILCPLRPDEDLTYAVTKSVRAAKRRL
jgi:hypothetical protein